MIQVGSFLNIADNSGAKIAVCIKILGFSKKRYASIGDLLKVSVKKIISCNSKVKKGAVYNSILVRTVYNFKRYDSSYISFNENSIVLLNDKKDFIGSRIFGPIVKELKKNFILGNKLSSFSSFII